MAGPARAGSAAWYTLAVLIAVYLVYYIDKQIFSLLVNVLEEELGFTDAQIGVLQGFAYAIPHSLGLVVLGALVDKTSRKLLLASGVVVWSLAAAASGLSHTFGAMAASRALVGLGEAAMIPVAMSLLASAFPRERLSFAVSVFYAGSPLGGIVALLLGGYAIDSLVHAGPTTVPVLGELQPWQAAFVFTGAPGLAVALLVLTIPAQHGPSWHAAHPDGTAPEEQSLSRYITEHWRFLLTHAPAFALFIVGAVTIPAWSAAFFGRAFSWDHGAIGRVLALGMAGSAVGNVLWGYLADRLRHAGYRDGLYRMWMVLPVFGVTFCVVAYLTRSPVVCVPAFVVASAITSGTGSMMAPLQLAAPQHLRGRLTGLYALFTGLVGLGLGPAAAGLLTDYLFNDRGMLGPAIILTITAASLAAIVLLALGRRAFLAALASAEARLR